MRVVSGVVATAAFAVATLAVSTVPSIEATAVETSTDQQLPDVPALTTQSLRASTNTNASSNATSLEVVKAGIQRKCGAMWSFNWDEIQHACAWDHSWSLDDDYNLFFYFYDGRVRGECGCDKDLFTYTPWGARWKYMVQGHVSCFTREHDMAFDDIKGIFSYIHC